MCRGQSVAALRKNQKCRLEGLFGIMVMTGDPSAHAENHGTMHPHQTLERVLITPFEILLEQLPIGQRLGVGREIAFGIRPSQELHQNLSASSDG